jgi:hypothetical protein
MILNNSLRKDILPVTELSQSSKRCSVLKDLEENQMKSRLKITSVMVLIAMVFSLVPALASPSQASAAACYHAQFVADVTVPDGTKYEPGTAFKKTWRLKNIGECAWNGVTMIFDSGSQMGAPASVAVASDIKPGQTVDVSVDMTAPNAAGHYIGYWKFKSDQGAVFGIGVTANRSWWVEINVTSSSPSGSVVYDFNAGAKDATWSSGAGGLSFPGKDGDAKGFALTKDKPKFESGVELSKPGLLFVPQNITNGFIQAEYPSYKVDPGDYFQTTVGCEFSATSCYVAYRLDYKVGNTIKTFWTFRERYEGWTYNANISLAPLSGQDVRFILYISAYGSPSGDRAIWGNPVITRKGIVPPPPTVTGTPPTATPSKTPAPVTQTVPPSSCDKVQFVADVNFPDGTVVQPGAQFTKTWRLKNVGSCAWSTSYELVFFSGEKMGSASSAKFPKNVAIGETVDVSMNMTAPSTAGSYRGYWMFKNANGALFGIGAQANKPWWVDIKVTGGPTVTPGTSTVTATQGGPTVTPSITPTPQTGTAYDFAANACDASWHSGAGPAALPCPGTEGDAKGFVLKVSNPKLENGTTDSRAGLITFPENKQDGYIQGIYPVFKVQSGDRFQSTINCEFGAPNCYVVFRLDYQTGTEPIKTFWGPFLERVDTPPQVYNVDVDLSPLAGKDVRFILSALAVGSPVGDRALWVGPRIFRPGGGSSPTATPSPTQNPTSGWEKYFSEKYSFEFKYPTGASISNQSDIHARITLPVLTPGTNLSEKVVDVSVIEGASTCKSPDIGGTPSTTDNVTINGIQFFKEMGTGAGAGNTYDFVAYSSMSNNNCVSLTFTLHSTNPGNYPTPPPEFDKAAESAVFDVIINTFDWTG